MKNYCHRTPRTYLSGLSSLKRDRIQLAFKKKTFEISGNYYKDDKTTSNVRLCMLDIQNDKKIKSNLLWETLRGQQPRAPQPVGCADARAPSDLPTWGDVLAC